MEIKDGKIIITDSEKEILNSDTGKKWLHDNNFIEIQEKEVTKPMTAESVESFLQSNQSLNDKIYNGNVIKFLKGKLGDADINTLGEDIVLKKNYTDLKNTAIKNAVAIGLSGISKHSNLLIKDVDFTKLDFKDGQLTGFEEAVTDLKGKYPDLFVTENKDPKPQTPPALGGNGGGLEKITYEQFEKMTPAERAKVTDEQLNEILKG